MTPFPYPLGTTPGDVVVSFLSCGDGGKFGGSVSVRLVDEGGGHFLELEIIDGKVRLDPPELIAIAAWCADTCAEMDAQVAEMRKRK